MAGLRDLFERASDTLYTTASELRARIRSLWRLRRVTDRLESAEVLFLALGRVIEARDPSTEGHCERLACYATALGAALSLEQPDLDTLYRGAFLHDIGKIAIPDRILLKKSRLTIGEFGVMKKHPAIGEELCRTVRSLDAVQPIVRHHHERVDGMGYPDGLSGDQIPLLARIVTVVDVFDALTTERPYRAAMTSAQAYAILREETRDGAYSPDLVEAFVDLHQRGSAGWPQRDRRKRRESRARSHGRRSRAA